MRCMLHSAPFAVMKQIHLVQPLMLRIAKRTVEIAIEEKPIGRKSIRHSATLQKWLAGVYSDIPIRRIRDARRSTTDVAQQSLKICPEHPQYHRHGCDLIHTDLGRLQSQVNRPPVSNVFDSAGLWQSFAVATTQFLLHLN